MAGLQSPVRRLSADLSQNESTPPPKQVNLLKNLLKSSAQPVDSTSAKNHCETHESNKDKVIVKLKNGTTIKICKSCAKSSSVLKNVEKPKKQAKPKEKNEKAVKQPKRTARKPQEAENATENQDKNTSKRNVSKTTKETVTKTKTIRKRRDPNINNEAVHDKVVDNSIKKPTRQRKKNDNVDDEKNYTNDDHEKNNTIGKNNSESNINNDTDHSKVIEKSMKKPSRQRKKNNNNVDTDKRHVNDDHDKNDNIDKNKSKLNGDPKKLDIVNDKIKNHNKTRRGKNNSNESLEQQLNDPLRNTKVSLSKDSKPPNLSTIEELSNNTSTASSSRHTMEIPDNALDDNLQDSNQSIFENETIKNDHAVEDNNLSIDNPKKLDTTMNTEKNVDNKRQRVKKNKKDSMEKKQQTSNNIRKSQSISTTIGEQNNNISSDDPSFNNMQTHSTSVEDNVHPNIHKEETFKMNYTIPNTKFMKKRIKKEPVTIVHENDDNIKLPESPKKPSQYQLVVKESPKTKQRGKKKSNIKEHPVQPSPRSVTESPKPSTSKKSQPASSKQQKKKTFKNNKKCCSRTDLKVAKAIEKMSKYYANYQEKKAIEDNLTSTESESESESSSSEDSSSCSCCDETSSGDHCRCYNCLMSESSSDSFWTDTSDLESGTSDESCSYSSSSSSNTSRRKKSEKKSCSKFASLKKRH